MFFCCQGEPQRNQFSYAPSRTSINKKLIHQIIKKKVTAKDLQKQFQKGGNWIDPEFPHDNSSIGNKIPKNKQILWKRAHQFIDNPVLFKNGVSASDIAQGNIGDCYFLSTIAALANYKDSLNIYNLFFPDQPEKQKEPIIKANPAGFYAVYVQIWGKLTQVIVDDYFPVYKAGNNKYKTVFSKPIESQIWVMILEKVWAKHKKNYHNIQAGYPHQVFTYFSNAPCFNYDVDQTTEIQVIKDFMGNAYKNQFPTCVSTRKHIQEIPFTSLEGKVETVEDVGIISEHSYVMLGAFQIEDIDKNKHFLIKLMNPWAHKEWVGRYSDHDPFWKKKVSPEVRKQLGIVQKNDGVFYLGPQDFVKYFNSVDCCTCINNQNYSSSFLQPITSNHRHAVYLRISILNLQQTIFFIVNQKSLDQNNKNKSKFARCKMLIAKQIQKQNNQKDYDFRGGNVETNWPDNILCLHGIEAGNYILYIKCEWAPQVQNQFILTSYADQYMSPQRFKRIQNGIPDFLEKVLKSHSKKKPQQLQDMHQYQQIKFDQLDIVQEEYQLKSFLLLQRAGLGYIYAKVNPNNTKKKLQIEFNPQQVKKSGFKLKRSREQKKKQSNSMKQNTKKKVIQVLPGEQKIVIFKVGSNLSKGSEILFPPKLKISQTY